VTKLIPYLLSNNVVFCIPVSVLLLLFHDPRCRISVTAVFEVLQLPFVSLHSNLMTDTWHGSV